MKIFKKMLLLLIIFLIFQSPFISHAEVPYYTYTGDSKGEIILTQTAYVPAKEIRQINNERLAMPEHVFVDQQDYVYITDSTLNKIIILDPDYQYEKELVSDHWTTVKSTFVTDEYIYAVDLDGRKIVIFDKESHEYVKEISTPDAPVFKEGYSFQPTHVAVDVRGNIYVRSTESNNGLIMLNRDGEFITFFGANPLEVPILDKIRSFFLTETQKNRLE